MNTELQERMESLWAYLQTKIIDLSELHELEDRNYLDATTMSLLEELVQQWEFRLASDAKRLLDEFNGLLGGEPEAGSDS